MPKTSQRDRTPLQDAAWVYFHQKGTLRRAEMNLRSVAYATDAQEILPDVDKLISRLADDLEAWWKTQQQTLGKKNGRI